MRQIVSRSFFQAITATVLVVCLLQIGAAQVMESDNFKIQSDSINTGGGQSTSTNYGLESTAGEIGSGDSSSDNYNLRAGYQQMQDVYLSLTAVPDVIMAPGLGGLTGGTATGSTAFSVTTDSAAGYTVTINAENSPAMQSGVNSIADYMPTGGVPDFTFTTDATDAHFAYSPEGADIAVRFQDASSACGVPGSDTSDRCFDGLSTTPVEIVRATTSNHPVGATTTLQFRVGLGGNVVVPQGMYQATTTITALAL